MALKMARNRDSLSLPSRMSAASAVMPSAESASATSCCVPSLALSRAAPIPREMSRGLTRANLDKLGSCSPRAPGGGARRAERLADLDMGGPGPSGRVKDAEAEAKRARSWGAPGRYPLPVGLRATRDVERVGLVWGCAGKRAGKERPRAAASACPSIRRRPGKRGGCCSGQERKPSAAGESLPRISTEGGRTGAPGAAPVGRLGWGEPGGVRGRNIPAPATSTGFWAGAGRAGLSQSNRSDSRTSVAKPSTSRPALAK
eukprot:scaffold20903_cov99-Isochrysis_galbana.AAC.8